MYQTNKCTYIKCVYHVLSITYMFRSLFRLSSVYLHKNTDKIQQNVILLKSQAILPCVTHLCPFNRVYNNYIQQHEQTKITVFNILILSVFSNIKSDIYMAIGRI